MPTAPPSRTHPHALPVRPSYLAGAVGRLRGSEAHSRRGAPATLGLEARGGGQGFPGLRWEEGGLQAATTKPPRQQKQHLAWAGAAWKLHGKGRLAQSSARGGWRGGRHSFSAPGPGAGGRKAPVARGAYSGLPGAQGRRAASPTAAHPAPPIGAPNPGPAVGAPRGRTDRCWAHGGGRCGRSWLPGLQDSGW